MLSYGESEVGPSKIPRSDLEESTCDFSDAVLPIKETMILLQSDQVLHSTTMFESKHVPMYIHV